MIKKNNHESKEKLSSESLAALIVDELVVAGLIKKQDFKDALRITALEIDIRKHAGDY